MFRFGFRITLALLLSACFAGFGTPAECSILYVHSDGNDAAPGNNWETAKKTIQAAIELVDSPDDEIWVAQGVYAATIPGTYAWSPKSITLSKGSLYGGFAGYETQRSERVPGNHPTVLDGTGNPASVVSITRDSAFPSAVVVVDGFTIGGGSDGPVPSNGLPLMTHGGIFCSSATAVISNNYIVGNTVGVLCAGGSVSVLNNRITGNYTGGIVCYYNSSYPGATPVIANNLIYGNGSQGRGSAIRCDDKMPVNPTIVNNTIVGNNGCGDGGAVYLAGGGTLSNNIIAFNVSGLCVTGTMPVLKSNCVFGNTVYNYSGIPTDPSGTDGNISQDPMLVSCEFGQLHIKPYSPCKDTGLCSAAEFGALDIDGQPRIQGAHIDIGADESDGQIWDSDAPVVIHVSPDGDDINDGRSWGTAKRSVQGAIDEAALTGGEVWVAKGTYNERINLQPYVYVYGGFGGDEENRDQRNWVCNRTILDAQGHGTVVSAFLGFDTSAIDGFTIRGGGIDPASGTNGGGIVCMGASPLIANNTITLNSGIDGGGILCSQSGARIVNNVICGNNAERGGGVCFGNPTIIASDIIPVMINNTITGNAAANGGGVYCELTTVGASNNLIAFNSSGMSIVGRTPVLSSNCVFGNKAYNYTGITDPTGTNGNISQDPKLVAWEYGNVRIQPNSPCKDAGDNNAVTTEWFDMDKQPRLQGDRVDIGADESNGESWTAQATVIRVNANGNDLNDGSSWSKAKRTVQAAIDAAAVTGGDVWVAAGHYKERITLPGYVYLYGGFSYDGDTASRDPKVNLTVLDGEKLGSVVTAKVGPGMLDGFKVQGGNGTVVSGIMYGQPPIMRGESLGGGVFATSPLFSLANCSIQDNMAHRGGGVYGAGPVSNCVIDGNSAVRCGGGLYCYGPFAVISGATVSNNNSLESGGGIAGDCTVVDALVTQNKATLNGGGVHGADRIIASKIIDNTAGRDGAGLSGCLVAENCTITGNTAGNSGGGALVSCAMSSLKGCTITGNKAQSGGIANNSLTGGGGVLCRADANISDNTIAANIATSAGGGVCLLLPRFSWQIPTLSSNVIKGNTAAVGGGVSYDNVGGVKSSPWDTSPASISRNQILSNTATDGGGIYSLVYPIVIGNVIAKNTANRGGGLYGSPFAFLGNTVVNNRASDGAATYITSAFYNMSYANNILAFHKSTLGGAKIGSQYNAFYNPDDTSGSAPDGVDPKFVSWQSGNYHLSSDSPCRGRGLRYGETLREHSVYRPSLDIDGQKREYMGPINSGTGQPVGNDAGVDIGADEWWPGVSDAKTTFKLYETVSLSGVIVTAVLPRNTFYVESQDRTCGILAELYSHGMSVGMRVDLTGKVVKYTTGELALRPTAPIIQTGYGKVEPLALNNKALGGGKFGLQDGVLGWVYSVGEKGEIQKTWGPVSGLNNIGLLVKTWGKVTQLTSGSFYLDDGSGVPVKCISPSSVSLPQNDQYVQVTGISSCVPSNGGLERVIRIRCKDDIVPVETQGQ